MVNCMRDLLLDNDSLPVSLSGNNVSELVCRKNRHLKMIMSPNHTLSSDKHEETGHWKNKN